MPFPRAAPLKIKDNQRYGRLTVQKTFQRYEPKHDRNVTYCECLCDCGTVFTTRSKALGGDTNSCGCLRVEISRHNAKTRKSGKRSTKPTLS